MENGCPFVYMYIGMQVLSARRQPSGKKRMVNMSRSKKQNDPLRTLIRVVLILAAATVVCAALFFGLNAFEQHSLAQKVADTKAANLKKQEQYDAALAEYQAATQKGENLSWPAPKPEGWDVVDLSAYGLENTQSVTLDRSALMYGGMMLVNAWHPLPGDFSDVQTLSIGLTTAWRVAVQNAEVKLFQPAIDALDAMIRDATAGGLKDFIVWEGYRTMEKQTSLFDAEKEKLSKRYSGDTLIEQAKKSVNYPGTSEYQSGFAFNLGLYNKTDITVRQQPFQGTPQGIWVTENSWKYGIIFRFPTADFPNSSWVDKSFKTGVTVPLNLYRYVGIPNAAVMHAKNFCLEEYIEYLIAHPHLAVYENGTLKYEIYRQEIGDAASATIQVPLAASSYISSLDNMGGVVTAFVYE